MQTPEVWQFYQCADFFSSTLAETGWWDEPGQCWYIHRAIELYVDEGSDLLVIGRPGVDGILCGYRQNHHGVWAFYPNDRSHHRIAETAEDLRAGYGSGRITV